LLSVSAKYKTDSLVYFDVKKSNFKLICNVAKWKFNAGYIKNIHKIRSECVMFQLIFRLISHFKRVSEKV
jgi:MinD superfamily P-loop ATPase